MPLGALVTTIHGSGPGCERWVRPYPGTAMDAATLDGANDHKIQMAKPTTMILKRTRQAVSPAIGGRRACHPWPQAVKIIKDSL